MRLCSAKKNTNNRLRLTRVAGLRNLQVLLWSRVSPPLVQHISAGNRDLDSNGDEQKSRHARALAGDGCFKTI